MVVVDFYNFDNHISKLTFRDCEDAAFYLVNYDSANKSLGLWLHKSQPGFYALLSFPK